MATCGYLCPVCEGKGYIESGDACTYCEESIVSGSATLSDEEWMKEVHEGGCCSDSGNED